MPGSVRAEQNEWPGAGGGAAAPPGAWNGRAVFGLGFLTIVSSFNYLDRSLLGLVLPQIKAEMHLSDTALGLVSGLAFVLFYALMGIPIATLADRLNRRNIIAIGFFFWSLMAAATGFVTNVWQLATARFLMGAGEACGIPPSNSMLSDLFAKTQRPTALAIFGTAVSISSILYFPLAGWISDTYGWRTTFQVAGWVGMGMAVLFFLTMKEPVRGASDGRRAGARPARFMETVRFLLRQRAYLLILFAVTWSGAHAVAIGTWSSTFLVRVHGMSLTEVGSILGPYRGVLSMMGILTGGILTDRLGRRDERWRLWTPACIPLILAPAEAVFLLSDDKAVWITAMGVASFCSFAGQGAVFAAVLSLARLRMRAVATSILILFSSLVSQIVGPLVVGVLNDALTPSLGAEAVRYSLLVVVIGLLFGAIAYGIGGISYAKDVARAAEEDRLAEESA